MSQFDDDEFTRMLGKWDLALLRWCQKHEMDAEAAEDLWQDAKVTAWEKRADFRGDSELLTWMIGIAKMKLLNRRRKRGEVITEDGMLDDSEPGYAVLKSLRQEERENFVLECIKTLDPLEQRIAYLRYAEDTPLAQIDRELKLTSASGSRGVIQRLKRKLEPTMRARLAEMGHGTSFVHTTW